MHTLFFWMLCCLPDLNRNSSTTSFVSLCRYADLIIVLDPRAFSRRFPWHLQGGLVFPPRPTGSWGKNSTNCSRENRTKYPSETVAPRIWSVEGQLWPET